MTPCLNPDCALERHHDGGCKDQPPQVEMTAGVIRRTMDGYPWVRIEREGAPVVMGYVVPTEADGQHMERAYADLLDLRSAIGRLIDKPDFKVGRLIRADSLREVLDD